MKKLRISLAQLNLLVGDIEGNAELVIKTTNEYAKQGADLVVFPELCLTGYPPEDLLYRPALHERVHTAVERIKLQIETHIIIGLPIKHDHEIFNGALLLAPKTVITEYHKQELPNYNVFDEMRYFTRGDQPCIGVIHDIPFAITICEDIWHKRVIPQAITAGAKLIISLNASPYHRDQAKRREQLFCEQAKTNHIPIVYVNQVGGQDELVFDGGSMVINNEGRITHHAAFFREEIMTVDFTANNSVTPLDPMTITEPNPLQQIYQALVLGVRDYANKNGFPDAIIGLSGGIDSALTIAIAVDALGPERVSAVIMPSRYSLQLSIDGALKIIHALQIKHRIISIEPMFDAFLKALAPEFAGRETDTTEENLQARIRGMLLMALSNKFGSLVLTTGNKSEFSVGYATLYGDMAGGFSVLKDVPKTLVYQLVNWRNQQSPVIPEEIIKRPPSAELAADQLDQDSLPPYPILDEILMRYIERDQSIQTICNAGFDEKTVKKVVRMINHNEYKRRQAPIGIRITERAFGKDRRYPITSGYHKAE